jgi:hypothetical protein
VLESKYVALTRLFFESLKGKRGKREKAEN